MIRTRFALLATANSGLYFAHKTSNNIDEFKTNPLVSTSEKFVVKTTPKKKIATKK